MSEGKGCVFCGNAVNEKEYVTHECQIVCYECVNNMAEIKQVREQRKCYNAKVEEIAKLLATTGVPVSDDCFDHTYWEELLKDRKEVYRKWAQKVIEAIERR
jgi:hypothetical protein